MAKFGPVWTEEEILLLKSKYVETPNIELVKEFPGRTIVALERKAYRLGLNKYKCIAKRSEKEIRELMNKEGYTLIEYNGSQNKLICICPKGHIWKTVPYSFKSGYRCAKCAGMARLTIEEIKSALEKEGYTLLSDTYKNAHQKLECICPEGHEWSVSWNSFKNGKRCYTCSPNAKLEHDYVEQMFEQEGYELISEEYKNNSQKLLVRCDKGHKYRVMLHNFQRGTRCPVCDLSRTSRAEKELADFVKSLDVAIRENTRSIIPPYELDIYVPSKKVAIEYCGLYWHAESILQKSRDYHRIKMDMCNSKGIRLITIFEDEYLNHPEVVKSRIQAALGLVDDIIYARKCSVKRLDKAVSRSFMETNHLQGKSSERASFGLFYDGHLVSAMSVGMPARAHNRKDGLIELKRFCSKTGLLVVGGMSKLFTVVRQYCSDNEINKIVSYCDMRWASTKPVYEKVGFELVRESKYTPHYLRRYRERVRNQTLAINKDVECSEWEHRKEQGYDRIWDCGHRTYVYTLA